MPLDRVADFSSRLPVPMRAIWIDLGAGIVRMALADGLAEPAAAVRDLRARSMEMGGTLFIERAPTALRRECDAFGEVIGGVELMRSLKTRFDPDAILNPGRFVAGI